MYKVSQRTLILISGMVWLAVGLFLISLGLKFIFTSPPQVSNFIAVVELVWATTIAAAILVGILKGRFVLAKSARRQIKRISSLETPIPIHKIYTLPYYLLLGGMMGLGFLMRVLPVTTLARGGIDVAIGVALITGALVYFRHSNVKIKVES